MRPLKRLISLDEALALALGRAKEITSTESVPIVESDGRVSAESISSKISVPPFSRSAMDGYAVIASDTYSAGKLKPIKLTRKERIYAGSVPKATVTKGKCAEIATGAMLPKGANAVVVVEDTEVAGEEVLVYEPVHPGQNVSRRGEDILPGAKVISKGDLLNPSKIGALAAIGRKSIKVYSKPTVAVVPTGDEIAALGSPLKPGQVYNINSYTLGSVVRANGGNARLLDIAGDSVDELGKVVRGNRDCSMIVFSGGSSVGERDVILDVLEKSGEVAFHGIAVKPGKPTIFGTIGDQLVFGMPGYPTSCLSNAYIILAPVLRKIARLPENMSAVVDARMAKRVVSTTGRAQFLTVRLENGIAYPAFKESGAITSMAYADGYVMIPADIDLIEKDERVVVHLL